MKRNAPDSPPAYVTVDEAAAILRVDRKTLYEAIRAGEIPGVQRIKRVIRIKLAALTEGKS